MKRTIRKQTQQDFFDRIERLDPTFAAKKPSERFDDKPWEAKKKTGIRAEHPFLMLAAGLLLSLAAAYSFTNPDGVRAFLVMTGWPAQFLSYAMNGVVILIIGFTLFLVGNFFRIFNSRATGRWNAGGLVVGAIAGLALFNAPEPYVSAAYAAFDFDNAGDALNSAQARTIELANIDWASVVMVSSSAK